MYLFDCNDDDDSGDNDDNNKPSFTGCQLERDAAIFYRNMFIFGHSLMDSSSLIILSVAVCVYSFRYLLPSFSVLVFGGCAVLAHRHRMPTHLNLQF